MLRSGIIYSNSCIFVFPFSGYKSNALINNLLYSAELLYGSGKSKSKKIEEKYEVKVSIVGNEFDLPDPTIEFVDDWPFDRPYVLVRGAPKCVEKAVKVVSHLLCKTAYKGVDKDSLKRDIAAATCQCAIVSGGTTEFKSDSVERHHIATTSGEDSYYASMQAESGMPREFPSPSFQNPNHKLSYRINFPSWMTNSLVVGRIIGTGGENVKRLEGLFNVKIETLGPLTNRRRDHPSDQYDLKHLVCKIKGRDNDQITNCRLHLESIAVRSAEDEWRGKLAYDLAVAATSEWGYSEHCYYDNPRDGSTIVSAVWPQPGSCKYMSCIDVTRGTVEAPEILGDLEQLEQYYYCQIYLWGSIEEPYIHVLADTFESVEGAAYEIYRRLTTATENSGVDEVKDFVE